MGIDSFVSKLLELENGINPVAIGAVEINGLAGRH